ncbi:GAF domain-containing protein [Leifsonia sp. NPDC102414]|uniref:GAF domain-containing protein n=1 Tax=Leifsonia sp. NPDC102414 TaxID=3364124 RepID=UPI0038295242
MTGRTNLAADTGRFLVWTLLPVLGAAAVSVLGLLAAAIPEAATALRISAVIAACVLALLLLIKGIRDYRWGLSLEKARYDTVKELHNRLGPALDLMTELAMIDPSDTGGRKATLRAIADQCCAALVLMTPKSADVRAVVFAIAPDPDQLQPIGRFGRRDEPRTFLLDTPAGQEILEYLTADPQIGAELYPDIQKDAPTGYEGQRDRYRTFIRVPIWGNGTVFGMVTVDAPRKKSLLDDDKLLAELVASQLATAFAIAAPA